MGTRCKPASCLEAKPTAQSVEFGGKMVSVSKIARTQGIDRGYVSRILSGQRVPRIPHAKKIAAALGMGLEEFLAAIEARRKSAHAA